MECIFEPKEMIVPPPTPVVGEITYEIEMEGNVITLTGSDGSTSSITLPVYDGSVTP